MSKRLDPSLEYDVIRSDRSTADIVIERDGTVRVRAPMWLPDEKVREVVAKKEFWVHKNLAEWRDLNAARVVREFRNGEGFLYLGRSYRLRLVAQQEEPLVLRNGRFLLRRDVVERGSVAAARRAFRDYLTMRGEQRIGDRVHYFAPKIGVAPSATQVRELGHRWASYSGPGRMAFHWKCMMAPAGIVDYIVAHELCHFHHLDHSDAFWNELDKVMPTYRERRDWLRRNGAALDV